LENGIPIKSFYGDPNDTMLLVLQGYLSSLVNVDDVREKIK